MDVKSAGFGRLEELGCAARSAARELYKIGTNEKNAALTEIASAIRDNIDYIVAENRRDIENNASLPAPLIDRLMLDEERLAAIADSVLDIVRLDDPVGYIDGMSTRPNGLMIGRRRVPLGVIGMIYEARPNVTVDSAVLCLKTGNACILRGGKEAFYSNIALAKVMRCAIKKVGLPEGSINLIEQTDRETALELMRMNKYLDCLIPRGGAGLIRTVVESATVPVIETGIGNCHVYIDESAGVQMGLDILINAKTQRLGVCNTCESLLVHESVSNEFLPLAFKALTEKGVIVRGCDRTLAIIGGAEKAVEDDWGREYYDAIISCKIVNTLDEAIEHINNYGTHHSDAIVTGSYANADRFLKEVDSAAVYVNASTRFSDGGQFGFGAEIGISTQKIHARGPMGLSALTTYKYVIYGNGQIRE